MNHDDDRSNFDDRLHHLLDGAAQGFEPHFEPARMSSMIGRRSRRRGVFMVPLAAAAALLLLVGTVSALTGNESSSPRIAPADAPAPMPTTDLPDADDAADEPVDESTTTTTGPSTTDAPPAPQVMEGAAVVPPSASTTKAPNLMPGPTTPKDPPPSPQPPKDTAPADTTPKDTTPKNTTPPDTTPKNTTPPDTTPKNTTPPDTTPKDTTPKPPSIAFTANQSWTSSAGDPPFDEFSGTGPANGKIWVYWPAGNAYTYADGNGAWYTKVFFTGVAVGQTIEVKVKSEGEAKFFAFTRTG